MLAGTGPHPLTVHSIGTGSHTVFGSAVPMAFILSIILSTITFFTFRKKAVALNLAPASLLRRRYFFYGFKQTLAATFVMFGLAVAAGVVWQRLFGTLTVSTEVAALVTGVFAGVAAWYACTRTSFALLREG